MPRNEEELRIQKEFIDWCWASAYRWPDVAIEIPRRIRIGRRTVEVMAKSVPMVHVPNGEVRDSRTGAKLNAQGLRKGMLDLFMGVPAGKYCGLIIEVKKSDGRLSKWQKIWIAFFRRMGWRVEVCRSFSECINSTVSYLNLR